LECDGPPSLFKTGAGSVDLKPIVEPLFVPAVLKSVGTPSHSKSGSGIDLLDPRA
jgi:hypothetical protein